MSTPDFHKTPMGKKYYEYDLPRLIESNQQLAKELKRQNDLNEKISRKKKPAQELKRGRNL
tara:strand:- start:421 stop:603 length:183 start_codon:yes stop_codon:yes gene_type:complete